MEIGAATDIIARMKERYASVHANESLSAKDRYNEQVKLGEAYEQANHGFAFSATEVRPTTVFQIEVPDLSQGGASSWGASQAYADGAKVVAQGPASIEIGSMKMLKYRGFSQWNVSDPNKADDGTLIAAADGRARELQSAADQEAARKEIASVFSQAGMDETSIYQLRFDQRQDGSIAVSNHPLASQVEDMVNANQGLSTLIAFSLGFNGGHKLDV